MDIDGRDTHNEQVGILSELLTSLSNMLVAFYTDLGTRMDCITLIIQSEFGLHPFDNVSLGTDHGHCNRKLTMGGGVNGHQLYGRVDLDVTIDWRTVMDEPLSMRLSNNN